MMNKKYLSLLVASFLLMIGVVAGCNRPEPTREAQLLMLKSADEVAFSFEQISKMSADDLKKNIKDLSDRLEAKRKEMPRSLAGATFGSSEQPKQDAVELPTDPKDSVEFLALPLAVMKQMVDTE